MEKRTRWNRESVVSLAGTLANREGLAALTLTRLAEEMGVRPPSLFNHVQNREDLLKQVALGTLADLAGALEEALAAETPPEASLSALMETYRAFVRAHPGRYAATLAFPAAEAARDEAWGVLDRRIVAGGLGLARRFGLENEEALHALRAWRAFAHGFASLEGQGGFGIPLDADESYRRGVRALTPPGSR